MGSSTWDNTPFTDMGAGSSWKADDAVGSNGGAWAPDISAGDANPFDDFSRDNISKHANGDFEDGPNDGGCRVCHAEGHFARDCPDKPAGSDRCFNCGGSDHFSKECPNPRVEREFTGTCRNCDQVGHRAADCPEKPPTICKSCAGEGHIAAECTVNRMKSYLATCETDDQLSGSEVWDAFVAADAVKDLAEVKSCIHAYLKAYPEVTPIELENAFREAKLNTYLIAKEQTLSALHTIVSLQGEPDQKYVLSFQFSQKPRRLHFAEGWPSTPEENMQRLAEAGIIMDSFARKCTNCNEIGHSSKACEQEKGDGSKIAITCQVCNEEGHRARDCIQERKSNKKGCRNCGSEEHIAKECPEPRSAENVECKNCGQMGHFSRDCPDRAPETCHNCLQEGHRSKDCTNETKCRNCDEIGHGSRDCTKPTDWSRVKCTNCEEFGHSYKRCKNPSKTLEADDDNSGSSGRGGGWNSGGGGGDWNSGGAASGGRGGGWNDDGGAPLGGGGWGASAAFGGSGW